MSDEDVSEVSVLVAHEPEDFTALSFEEDNKVTVNTRCGEISAIVSGDPSSQPSIVTYHDIGLTYQNCFGGFMKLDEIREMTKNYATIHVIVPGQSLNAPDIPEEEFPKSVGELVTQLHGLLVHLKAHYCVGFGHGAGGTVLLHYAATHLKPTTVGLFLVSTCGAAPGITDSLYFKTASTVMSRTGLGDWVCSHFVNRHFSSEAQETNPEMIDMYRRDLLKMNPSNVLLYMRAYMNRSDVLGAASSFKFPVLIAAGRSDSYYSSCEDLFESLTNGRAEMIDFWGVGHLIMEEKPHELVEPLRLFLYGIGL